MIDATSTQVYLSPVVPDAPAPAAKKKPLITANQVTFARLLLLPIGSFLLYQGIPGQWGALFFMTLVGSTDFVDGWLARKYGPTVLGGLMDPIADKVFVAVTFLPVVELGWLPWYIVALLFLREFSITAARSAYERRAMALKTTYLAKVKTWFQMCGVGMIFLFRTVQHRVYMDAVCIGLGLAPIAAGLLFYLIKRKRWRGSIVFAFCFGGLAAVQVLFGPVVASYAVAWATLAITWASGGVYLFSAPEMVRKQPLDLGDISRLFGAFTMPVFATALVKYGGVSAWPIITAVALEFAMGGLDNLLSHDHERPRWPGWTLRTVSQAGLMAAALWAALVLKRPNVVFILYCATLAVTAVGAAILFIRHRRAYLGPRSEKPSNISTAPASWV